MKVRFVGFGGYMEKPCYEDENGKLYFDVNDGRNSLNLYSGAWKDKDCGEICGEPNVQVTEKIECDEPFVRHTREFDYRMLSRWLQDCKWYISRNGNCGKESLWADIDTILTKMEEMLSSFSEEDKPTWLTDEEFNNLKKKIENIQANLSMRYIVCMD